MARARLGRRPGSERTLLADGDDGASSRSRSGRSAIRESAAAGRALEAAATGSVSTPGGGAATSPGCDSTAIGGSDSKAIGGIGAGGASPKIWTPAVGLTGCCAAPRLGAGRAAGSRFLTAAAALVAPGFLAAALAVAVVAGGAAFAAVGAAASATVAPPRTGGFARALPVAFRTALGFEAVGVLLGAPGRTSP